MTFVIVFVFGISMFLQGWFLRGWFDKGRAWEVRDFVWDELHQDRGPDGAGRIIDKIEELT